MTRLEEAIFADMFSLTFAVLLDRDDVDPNVPDPEGDDSRALAAAMLGGRAVEAYRRLRDSSMRDEAQPKPTKPT